MSNNEAPESLSVETERLDYCPNCEDGRMGTLTEAPGMFSTWDCHVCLVKFDLTNNGLETRYYGA